MAKLIRVKAEYSFLLLPMKVDLTHIVECGLPFTKSEVLIVVVGAAAALFLVAGAAMHSFGSLDIAISQLLHIDSIQIRPAVLDLGICRVGETCSGELAITNLSNKTATLLGVENACSCVRLSDLPISVAPGETRAVSLTARFATVASSEKQQVLLYVGGDKLDRIPVLIRARVESDGQ